MKKLLLTLLFGILGVGVYGQTIKSLGYNTTNGQVVYSGTNTLAFTNPVVVGGDILISNSFVAYNNGSASIDLEESQLEFLGSPVFQWAETELTASIPLTFNNTTNAAATRTNLGLGWSALTNTNAANFRSSIGLGWSTLTNTNSGTALLAMKADGEIVYSHTNVEPYIIDRINVSARGNFEGYFYVTSQDAIQFQTDQGYDTAGITRTNMKIPWSGLTNTNASGFRSSLGLSGGITTNRTFVSYDGTNYTTNSVTISNGIITGWTQ